jgi:DNA mismatch repair protein MutH
MFDMSETLNITIDRRKISITMQIEYYHFRCMGVSENGVYPRNIMQYSIGKLLEPQLFLKVPFQCGYGMGQKPWYFGEHLANGSSSPETAWFLLNMRMGLIGFDLIGRPQNTRFVLFASLLLRSQSIGLTWQRSLCWDAVSFSVLQMYVLNKD